MRIGVIGYGSIGERHHRNLKAYCRSIIVLTKRRDVRGLTVMHSWRTFRACGPFDAIFITNETNKHLETIRRCIPLRPCALFVEKPVSHTSRGLSALERVLKRRRISCWVGYNLQVFRPLMRVQRIIASGRLGRLYTVRVSVGQDLRQWRTRDYRATYSSRASGGGVLLDLVHDINYPAWLLGEPLQPVAAIADRVSSLRIQAEDCAESLLRTPSGVIVSIHQDYVRIPAQRSLEIIAERGSLEWNSSSGTIQLSIGRRSQRARIVVDRNEMYEREVARFVQRLRAGRYFSNLAEAVRDVRIVHALKRLARPRRNTVPVSFAPTP